MAHIVCITGGLTSIFNASITLAQQLEQGGHHITYASPKDWSNSTAKYNIPFIKLDPWIFDYQEPSLSRWQKFRQLRERRNQGIKALAVENFAKTIKELKPDLLLIDMEMHPHIMTAVVNEFPVALLCVFFSIWKRPNLPPIHTNIIPGQGWRGQWFGIEWSWLRYGWRKWREYQSERWQKMGVDRISVLRCYAKKIGYPFREQFGFRQWLVPYPHQTLPILCLNALEMDFPHDPHPLMQYLGPMVNENCQHDKIEAHTHKTLLQLFEKRRLTGSLIIYCSWSTLIKGNKNFLQKVVEAVSSFSQWDLILGLGGKLNPQELDHLPSNVYAFDWVPQLEVLKHTDCVINNGGTNTINECIYFGVPMLIYSSNQLDHNGNAARVNYHGLGIVEDIRENNVTQMRTHIQTLLTDPSYKTQLNFMGNCFHRYTKDNVAIKVIDNLINEG